MSLILILFTLLLLLAIYRRTKARANSAIRTWARTYGYRVRSLHFAAMFSREFEEAGKEAELVYRAVLDSPSGERLAAYFLIWNLLWGEPIVLVRWQTGDHDAAS